jgi:uncharacterized protein involved in exopolysaccharide biosynthesis
MADTHDSHPTWNIIAKVMFAVLGALFTAALAWSARASEESAKAFAELKEVVYNGQTKNAVLENRVGTIEKEQDKVTERVRKLESRVFEGQR